MLVICLLTWWLARLLRTQTALSDSRVTRECNWCRGNKDGAGKATWNACPEPEPRTTHSARVRGQLREWFGVRREPLWAAPSPAGRYSAPARAARPQQTSRLALNPREASGSGSRAVWRPRWPSCAFESGLSGFFEGTILTFARM